MDKSSRLVVNPLEQPIVLRMPARDLPSAWMEHIPFAMYLTGLTRPRVLVELGTFYGVSYCAFCQAVKELSLDTKCYAVDTWEGDPQTGLYGSDVLADLRRHHDPLYGGFSTLIQKTFDQALNSFADGSVDMLHIDGLHTYEAVKHDFEAWLPKMSEQGLILFHDTNERTEDFGVWKLWDELKANYPSIEFLHGHGLGVIAVGGSVPEGFAALAGTTGPERRTLQEFFYELGRRIVFKTELAETRHIEGILRTDIRRLNEVNQRVEASIVLPVGGWMRAARKMVRLWRRGGGKFVLLTVLERLNTGVLSRVLLRFWPYRYRRGRALQPADLDVGVLPRQPLISIIMPVYNTPVRYLRAAINSIRNQMYPNWELSICDDGSTSPDTIAELRRLDGADRIRVVFSRNNTGISAATNTAARNARGEWFAFMDHDDELTADALYEIVRALNDRPETDAFYSDHDKINFLGSPSEPFFKPDWSPEYFRSVMYVGHLLVVKRDLFERINGFRTQYDGVQDFEFMLRLSEATGQIRHIPKILYHWRKIPGSVAYGLDEKGDVIEELQAKAVIEQLSRLRLHAVAAPHPKHRHRVVVHPTPRRNHPLISIIVLTMDAPQHIARCLESIYTRTTYPNYEVVAVDNNTSHRLALKTLEAHPVKVVRYDGPFNYSHANNLGVQRAAGEYIVLINNDIEIITPGWLEHMLFYAEMPDVAGVGPLLIYPDKRVQHAGIALGFRGTADHVLRGFPHDADGYAGSLSCPREVSAVTGACMLMKRDEYLAIGGLEERYGTHYQDVDLCLRLRALGKRIIYDAHVLIVHHEGATRGSSYDYMDRALLLDTWGKVIEGGDPYYNQNFLLEAPYYIPR